MEAALGLLLVLAIAGSGLGAWRLTSSPRRVLSPEREAMRSALHHAIATLPHLRRGLDETSAKAAAPHLRALTQATAVAITDGDTVLALDGISGSEASASHLRELAAHVMDGRVHVQPRTNAVRLSGSNGFRGGCPAGHSGRQRRRIDRPVRPGLSTSPGRRSRGRGGRCARLGSGGAVGRRRSGGAFDARRTSRVACPHFAALRLQLASCHRELYPLQP